MCVCAVCCVKMLIIIVDNNEIDDKNDEIKVENEIENWVEVLWENFYLIFIKNWIIINFS